MDVLTREAWSPIYNRWREGGEPDWKPHLIHFPPSSGGSMQKCSPLDQPALSKGLKRLRNRAAGGADGWRVQELKKMPKCFLTPLAHIHGCIEQGAPWPAAAQQILVTLLSKKGKASPLNMRPISVTPLLYRLWGAARWSDLVRHQESWIQQSQTGFRPGKGPTDSSISPAAFTEEGHAKGLLQIAVDLDLQKAFDHIPEPCCGNWPSR